MADNTVIAAQAGGDTIATDDIGGVKYQRIKATFGADGSATDVDATHPLPVQVGDASSQANVLAGDAGQGAQLVAGTRKEVSFSTTTVQAVASTDVSNYRWVSVHIAGQGTSSTITFQGSNDNTNWVSVPLTTSTSTAGPAVNSTTATGILHGPIFYRYFRLNVTGISAGTTAGVVEFYSMPVALQGLGVDTELPAAAALSDTAGNPSTPTVGAANLYFDGTNWKRVQTGGGLPVGGQYTELTGTYSGTPSAPTPVIASTDVRGYSHIYIHATGGSGSNDLRVQFSNDGTNFSGGAYIYQISGSITNTLFPGATGFGVVPVMGRYMRVYCQSYVSGTTTVTVELVNAPWSLPPSGTSGLAVDTELGTAVTPNDATAAPTGPYVSALAMQWYNAGGTWVRLRVPDADGQTFGLLGAGNLAYNGSGWDRARAASSAAGTTGTGLLGAGALGFDGTNYQRLKTNTSGALALAPLTSAGSAKTSVTTAGTRVQLASNACSTVTVRARAANAGLVYIGGSTVDAATGYDLSPGEAISLDVSNTNVLWIDAATNGDAVSYVWAA